MILKPLGDQAVLAYLPDEPAAVRFAAAVRAAAPGWLQDVVPAYASVGVFFDADRVGLGEVLKWLEGVATARERLGGQNRSLAVAAPRSHVIPVCYERQLDLAR